MNNVKKLPAYKEKWLGMSFLNSKMRVYIGKECMEEHQFALKMYKEYFEMLIHSCRSYSKDIQAIVFGICYFHFENFKNLKTIEEINFFLDICDYAYQFSYSNKVLFDNYRNFVNEEYKKFEDDNDFGLI